MAGICHHPRAATSYTLGTLCRFHTCLERSDVTERNLWTRELAQSVRYLPQKCGYENSLVWGCKLALPTLQK